MGDRRRSRIRALLRRAGAARLDPSVVEPAFVHESAAKESADHDGGRLRSNERLEFLGDAVLGFIVSRHIFERYPDASEGELALRKSSIVSDAALAKTAERLGFGTLLVVGGGLAREGATPSRTMLADAFEAFVAALARGAGIETAAAFVEKEHVEPRELASEPVEDPKTVLQEWSQRRHAGIPSYENRFEGPPHLRVFFATVEVNGEVLAEGSGESKKAAQRAAAAVALEVLGRRFDDVAPRKLSAPMQSSARPAAKKQRP